MKTATIRATLDFVKILPPIVTSRLVLRAYRVTDYSAWAAAHSAMLPKQNRYDIAPLPPELRTRAFFASAVRKHRELVRADRVYMWNVFLKSTGEFIGWVDISPLDRSELSMANLGYFVLNRHRRRGYSREAIRAVVPVAFRQLKLHRLEASIDPENRASIRTARAAGLFREGVKRHYSREADGTWSDQVIFVAIPELWKSSRARGKRSAKSSSNGASES